MWTAIIAILAAAQLVLAAPINDGGIKPIEHEPSYVRSPMGRGTMDLMFTCVITLSLCVWTAIHPNIEARDTYMARLRRKALYVVLGLFSPEIVMSQAFHEWREARNLRGWLHRETAKEILENAVEKAADLGGFPVPKSNNNDSDNSDHGLKQHSARIEGRAVSNSDDDRVIKARSDLLNAATKAWDLIKPGGSLSSTPDKRPLLWLRNVATRTRNKIEDAIGDIKELEVDDLARSREERQSAREEKRIENHRAKRILKELAALDTATKNYLSAKRVSEATGNHKLGCRVIERLTFKSLSAEKTPTFTTEIGFFVVMGGLTFSPIDHLKYRAYEQTISAHGLMALIRNKVVDPMRLLELRADIKDKGKSDLLAKVLVCAQAVWMMMNCLLRKAAGLPITVIELNVIVHVMSMIAIYACWWNKPHDAGMPIPLNNLLEDQAVCSLLFMRDKYPDDFKELEASTPTTGEKPTPTATVTPERPSEDSIRTASSRRSRLMAPIEGTPTGDQRGSGAESGHITPIAPLVERGNNEAAKTERNGVGLTLAQKGLLCKDAEKALRRGEGEKIRAIKDITRLPDMFEFNRSLVVVLIPLCLIYGGIHASLWNAYFPTPIERWLWRISACIVGIPGLGSAAVWGVKSLIFRNPGNHKKAPIENPAKYSVPVPAKTLPKVTHLLKNPLRPIFILIITILALVLLFALSIAIAAVPLGAMGGVIYGGILGNRKIMKLAVRWRAAVYLEFLCSIALGVVISGAGFVLAVTVCVQAWAGLLSKYREQLREVIDVPLAGAIVVTVLSVIVYCGARAFIFVETFICLRSLPEGAYKTVRWEEFWPHL